MLLYIVGSIAALILIIAAITARFEWVEIKSPNIGRISFKGAYLDQILFPGPHLILRKIFGISMMRVQQVPGGSFRIRIKPDKVISHNIPVEIDIEIDATLLQVYNPERQMMHVQFQASNIFLQKYVVPPGKTLLGYENEDGIYMSGVLDERFTGYSMDAITNIVPKYHPDTITVGTDAYNELKQALVESIRPNVQDWAETMTMVQHIGSKDVEDRTRIELNAATLAKAERTKQETEIDILEAYRTRIDEQAMRTHQLKGLVAGATLNVFMDGFNVENFSKAVVAKATEIRNERRSE
ncbi:MAG: hypothetical protein QG593_369 [Patescibacteria group bacterium]|nr:hypothetical protein [Patescibacteria group bacterium]